MQLERQKYVDSNIQEARAANCDTLQLKYDGWWVRVVCSQGEAKVFSRTQRLVHTFEIDPLCEGMFIGEYMFGTQWAQKQDRYGKIFFFDCWHCSGQDTTNFPYKERYNLVRTNLPLLGPNARIVNNYPITSFDDVWKSFVATDEFEGVVFRRRQGPVSDTLHRQKRKITKAYQAIGFEVGEGKHAGRLGAIIGRAADGTTISCGGGFDDTERIAIFNNQDAFRGVWFEVEGWKEFESGALRHPQFVQWRYDL